MIILDATNKKLQIVLAVAVTTNELEWNTSYADHTSTAFSPAAGSGLTAGATAVDVVVSPAAATQRQVKFLSVYNADTVAAVVTVKVGTAAVDRILVKVTLTPGETLIYTDGGFEISVVNSSITDVDAFHKSESAEISGLAEETDPANGDLFLLESSSNSFAKRKVQASNLPFPDNHIHGLKLTRPTVSTIQVAIGDARDDGNLLNLSVGSPLTADITASGTNGLDTGAEAADTWYSVWVIGGGGNLVALLLSISSTSPTLPGTYTAKRRAGWVRNDSTSDLRNFEEHGKGVMRHFVYAYSDRSDLLVFSAAEPTVWTNADCSEFVPPTSRMCELSMALSAGAGDYMEFRFPGSGLANGDGRRIYGQDSAFLSSNWIAALDSARSIDYRRQDVTGGGGYLRIHTYWDFL